MVEQLGSTESSENTLDSEKRAIGDLLKEISQSYESTESIESYPKTPEEVLTILQHYATTLQEEIEETNAKYTVKERGGLTIALDPTREGYAYTLTSYGKTTAFQFIPQRKIGRPNAGRFVLSWNHTEHIYENIGTVIEKEKEGAEGKEEAEIKQFLNFVNSANKELERCKDYEWLIDLERKINNIHNKDFLDDYKKRYDRIMAENDFYNLKMNPNKDNSMGWDLLDSYVLGNVSSYMNARRKSIKEEYAKKIDPLFAERGLR